MEDQVFAGFHELPPEIVSISLLPAERLRASRRELTKRALSKSSRLNIQPDSQQSVKQAPIWHTTEVRLTIAADGTEADEGTILGESP